MKHLSALILVTSLFSPSLSAELEGDIPWGLEAVTGARTGYAYRGFDLAGPLFDFQLEGELVLREDLSLNAGGWFLFTGETARQGDFALQSTGRFAHGAGYLRTLAAANRFAPGSLDPITPRRDGSHDIQGLLGAFQII